MEVEKAANRHEIEPMDAQLWFSMLREISRDHLDCSKGTVATLLRRSNNLALLTPSSLRRVVTPIGDPAAFEKMLATCGQDATAMMLVKKPLAFSMRAGPESLQFEATVSLPRSGIMGRAANNAIGLALILAWCECLTSLLVRQVPELILALGNQTIVSPQINPISSKFSPASRNNYQPLKLI